MVSILGLYYKVLFPLCAHQFTTLLLDIIINLLDIIINLFVYPMMIIVPTSEHPNSAPIQQANFME